MKKNVKVREILGKECNIEDAILLREIIRNNLEDGIQLDFEGVNRVATTFLNCLLNDLITKYGRKYVFQQVDIKNLSNVRDFSRVVLGTTF